MTADGTDGGERGADVVKWVECGEGFTVVRCIPPTTVVDFCADQGPFAV